MVKLSYARKWLFGAVLALLAAPGAFALDAFPPSDPRSVVQTVIALVDRHALPNWNESAFAQKMRPYVTEEFLAVIDKGGRIASKKRINIYDGEFFTGGQGVEHAKLFSASVSKLAGDSATVEASIGTTGDPNVEPTEGGRVRYQLKRVSGVWRIDDFRDMEDYAKSRPSVKTLLSDPVRFGQ